MNTIYLYYADTFLNFFGRQNKYINIDIRKKEVRIEENVQKKAKKSEDVIKITLSSNPFSVESKIVEWQSLLDLGKPPRFRFVPASVRLCIEVLDLQFLSLQFRL